MCTVLFLFIQRQEDIYFVKGALEKVLQQCTKYASNGVYHPLNMKKEQDYLAEAYEIGRKGLRGETRNMCHTMYYITHMSYLASQCSQYQSMPLVIILRQFYPPAIFTFPKHPYELTVCITKIYIILCSASRCLCCVCWLF
jgi:hypothetical protein